MRLFSGLPANSVAASKKQSMCTPSTDTPRCAPVCAQAAQPSRALLHAKGAYGEDICCLHFFSLYIKHSRLLEQFLVRGCVHVPLSSAPRLLSSACVAVSALAQRLTWAACERAGKHHHGAAKHAHGAYGKDICYLCLLS